jgi:hypothetical protein
MLELFTRLRWAQVGRQVLLALGQTEQMAQILYLAQSQQRAAVVALMVAQLPAVGLVVVLGIQAQ